MLNPLQNPMKMDTIKNARKAFSFAQARRSMSIKIPAISMINVMRGYDKTLKIKAGKE